MHRPRFISIDTIRALGNRIAEHCRKHELHEFVVELHGGEPLLLGKERFRQLLHELQQCCPEIRLRFLLQTNGLLLDAAWLEIFAEFNVNFGLSIDGPPSALESRVYRNGKPSTNRLLKVISTLRNESTLFDELFGGVLCVIDPRVDGGELVRWFVANGFFSFEFLLPDGTHANKPERWEGPEPYRAFLVSAFQEWYSMGSDAPQVRMFETMIRGFLGEKPTLDALGGDLKRLCVVESDGSIGVSDVLRICGGSFAKDSIDIFSNELQNHQEHYNVDQIQAAPLTCRSCPFYMSCGGGYLPHRFDGSSFDNPSFYCDALFGVLKVIHDSLREDIPAKCWSVPPVTALTRAECSLQ